MSFPTNHSASKSSPPPKLTSVPSTGALDDKKTKQNCPSCSKPTNACDCQACELCQTPVPLMTAAAAKSKITLSPTELDRNCTRCGIVRCNKCTRKRSNFSGDSSHSCTTEVCTVCAVHTAINFLGTLPLDYNTPGLILLCEVVDRANMCVDPECGRFSYGKECTNCTMPTIQMETPYSGIYVPDVPKGREKVKELENRLSAERSRIFQEINFKARTLDDALINESVPDLTEDVKLNRRIMLAMICSSVAYEYKSIQIALHFTPFSYANVLLPLECSVARSIFDAPGKVRFVAFPGTHDLKTFHTNIKTSHVRVMLDAADESIKDHEERLKKPGYNVHKGFYRVMQQMKMFDDVLAWIEEGYEVIFCGHSQGGALAQLAAVHLFHHSLEKVRDNISVITMGTPCVGNFELLEMIKKWNVAHLFHHIIYGHDLIPRILHNFSEMKAKLSSLVKTVSHVWDNLFEKKKAKGALTDEAEAIFRKRQLPFVSFGVYHLIQVPKCGIYFFTKDNVYIHVLFSDDGIVPSPVSIHDHLLTNYFKGITHLELEIRHQSKKKKGRNSQDKQQKGKSKTEKQK